MTKKPTVKQLQEKVKELEQNWRRALADYQNLEKRIKKQRSDVIKFANASLIDKLLSVLDDLDRATQHHQGQKWVLLIRDRLRDILASEGVTEIKVTGAEFDPEIMDCAEIVKGPENKVINVLIKGYQYHDKVIRPAKVEVGKGGNQ